MDVAKDLEKEVVRMLGKKLRFGSKILTIYLKSCILP